MAIRDEIREQRQKLKGQSFRKKFEYFLDYYKIPVIIAVVLLLLLAGIVREMWGNKPAGFYALLINAEEVPEEKLGEIASSWYELLEIDPKKQEIVLDSALHFDPEVYDERSLAGITRVTAQMASKAIDCLIADPKLFQYYAEGGVFLDLRTVYSEEELSKYEGWIWYQEREGEQVPIGIVCGKQSKLAELGLYPDGGVFGIVGNSERPERSKLVLESLK